MNGGTVGKVVAVVVFLGVAGVVAVSVMRAPRAAEGPDASTFQPGVAPSGDFTIVDLPSGGAATDNLFDTGEAWVFRSTDDSGREREYRADTLDPLEAGRIRLGNPSAIIPTDDGHIEVRAAEGFIVRRTGGEPESGELRGDVLVTAFRDGSDAPFGTFKTDRLSFQESLRELRTEDAIAIDGEGFSLRSRGLTVRLGDARSAGARGLLYLRLHEGGRVEVDPGSLDSAAADTPGASKGRKGPSGKPGSSSVAVESFYRVLAAGTVELRSGEALLTGDRAEVVARLVDGALAPGAIRRMRSPVAPRDATAETAASEGPSTHADAKRQPPVLLAWTGALEMQLVDARPAELGPPGTDDVAIRWFGIGRNGVHAEDPTLGFFADASEVRYGATSGRARLTGKPSLHDVIIRGTEFGEMRSRHAEVDLGALPSITAWVDGPGTVRPMGAPDAEATVVTWGERADLTAERTEAGGVVMTSVSASGPVRAITPSGTVDAAFARAILGRHGEESRVERAILRDGFHAISAKTGESIEAEQAEIRFGAPTEGALAGMPEFARATGAVRIVQGDSRIDADAIAAELGPSPTGDITIIAGDAEGNVRASKDGSAEVRGPRVRIDRGRDVLTVSGPGSAVVITDEKQTMEVRADSMEVRRSEGRITAAGPGSASIRTAATPDAPESVGDLTWTDGLIYDDATGIAALLGRVEGTRNAGVNETQRLAAAGGATLELTPGVLAEDAETDPRLVSVTLHSGGDEQAEVEGRWYARGPTDNTRGALESVIALRSDEIALHLDNQRLTTPGAGVLVVEDRRSTDATGGSTAGGVSGRGTTAFRWDGSLTLDHAAGRATMSDGVRVSHLDAVSADVTELFAQTLEAGFNPAADADTSIAGPGFSPQVRSIAVRDGVRLVHRTITLECDAIDFDSSSDRFTARSMGASRVRGLDRRTGDSFLAESVRIDPRTGEWAGEGVTGITSSR